MAGVRRAIPTIPPCKIEVVKVGWIGVGVMGYPMAGNLIAAGQSVTAHDVNAENASRLLERGATVPRSEHAAGLDEI